MSWNDERVEQLKKLWAEGLSASQIADRLGSMTRNAIIGKIHRLGLQGRATTSRLNSRKPKKPKLAQAPAGAPGATRNWASFQMPVKFPTEALPPPKREFDVTKLVKFVDLEADQCKWPVGDPQQDEHFGFCGAKRVEGTPYCEDCCRVAFRPPALKNGARSVSGGRNELLGNKTAANSSAAPGASERDLEGVS